MGAPSRESPSSEGGDFSKTGGTLKLSLPRQCKSLLSIHNFPTWKGPFSDVTERLTWGLQSTFKLSLSQVHGKYLVALTHEDFRTHSAHSGRLVPWASTIRPRFFDFSLQLLVTSIPSCTRSNNTFSATSSGILTPLGPFVISSTSDDH